MDNAGISDRRRWHAEHACLNAWPALFSVVHDGWVMRFANGLSRRANSANPLHAEARIAGATLQYFENLFSLHDLPMIIRVPSLLDAEVDRTLERFGFVAEGESHVLFAALDALAVKPDPAVSIVTDLEDGWLAALNRMQGRSDEQSATFDDIMTSIALPAGFAALTVGGEAVALACGVLDGDMMVCESVITDPRHRGAGYGRRLSGALLHWARLNEASCACLQVETANAGGRSLYRQLGFVTELSRYHYRRRPL
ncbi:MAG: GNAT family N-acetyltransferase [Xanthobacteraceae bacterium]